MKTLLNPDKELWWIAPFSVEEMIFDERSDILMTRLFGAICEWWFREWTLARLELALHYENILTIMDRIAIAIREVWTKGGLQTLLKKYKKLSCIEELLAKNFPFVTTLKELDGDEWLIYEDAELLSNESFYKSDISEREWAIEQMRRKLQFEDLRDQEDAVTTFLALKICDEKAISSEMPNPVVHKVPMESNVLYVQAYKLTEKAKYQYQWCGYAFCLIENWLVTEIYWYVWKDESLSDALKRKPEIYTFGTLSSYEFCVPID